MEKDEVIKLIDEINFNLIDKVISGEINHAELIDVAPAGMQTHLEEKHKAVEISIDTNGWQLDYSITYLIDSKKYILHGCAFYGGINFILNK